MKILKEISIRSNLPGTVSFQFVDDGARVEKGAKVIAVECMKTMYDFEAKAAGIVRLRADLGDFVEQDQILAVIETE